MHTVGYISPARTLARDLKRNARRFDYSQARAVSITLRIAMLLSLTVAAWLSSSSMAVKPDTYSERWLCDLWAGAVCHATSCKSDAKDRCMAVSKSCNDTSTKQTVAKASADKKVACAKALLKSECGKPTPSKCEGMVAP